jgi:hypothetical protein
MDNIEATRRASAIESGVQQRFDRSESCSLHNLNIMPITLNPRFTNKAAATELSTPPLMATTTTGFVLITRLT